MNKFNKAIVAVVMGGLYLLNATLDIDVGVSEEAVSAFIVGLTPILTYLIPNAKD